MKSSSFAVLAVSLLALTVLSLTLSASARETVLPAGTLLKCTLNEPNLSSSTVAVGDPVLCHLHSVTEFGQQTFPRGAYLVGHLEAAKDPGHFWGKGYMKLMFDRIGLPAGDMPLDAKVIATRGYKVDKDGDIRGKGHAKRDIVEWMIPPLWPWKIIMLPARGPRPTLKGESMLTLRLMDDVQIPQVSATNGPDWHFFGRPRMENDSYYRGSAYAPANSNVVPQLAVRQVRAAASEPPTAEEIPQVVYASYVVKDARFDGTAPGVPVFVLKTGMLLEVGNYTYQDGRISYELASGGSGVISTDEVDWTTTTRVNSQRGVRMMLRGGHPSAGVTGF
ncbi:MAG TPA: hypothetical protein VJX30_10080 [Terriglobales bacterium]|jgi:hypothetical protein|nr:hypothetical protein [Terriglobales bacterium]